MTTEHGTKCCGSCRHFTNEDALGLGWCALIEAETTCGSCCKEHENKRNQKRQKTMGTREIVFRGKDADNDHEWRYGSLLVCPGGSPVIVCFDDDGGELSYDVAPATVGQFTGLHDSRGREIYEGDIVKFHFMKSDPCTTKLFPTAKFFGEITTNKYNQWAIFSDGMEVHIENATEYGEVVGNIFDNPELLKGGTK